MSKVFLILIPNMPGQRLAVTTLDHYSIYEVDEALVHEVTVDNKPGIHQYMNCEYKEDAIFLATGVKPAAEPHATMFAEGDQVIYTPTHAEGDINHPDSERGFVTSHNDEYVFCRFFHKNFNLGLRTTANSEACYPGDLVKHKFMPQSAVWNLIEEIKERDYGPKI